MTDITAKIIADSVGTDAPRLTTLHLRYPRFIHAELMTHRVFSRNARSSRAVPIATMIAEIENDPVVPLHWGAAQKGMQADRECDALVNIAELPIDDFEPQAGSTGYIEGCYARDVKREDAWLAARDAAVAFAKGFAEAGYHKQVVNRLLEPFMHIDTLVTATEWENFFALRMHKDAEPHMQMLAEAIRDAMATSAPKLLQPGEWHMPYVKDEEWGCFPQDLIEGGDGFSNEEAQEGMLRMSVARCARISYESFDETKRSSPGAEDKRYEKLLTSGHWSPFEHQATPDHHWSYVGGTWDKPTDHGNFVGWRQNRRIIERSAGKRAA